MSDSLGEYQSLSNPCVFIKRGELFTLEETDMYDVFVMRPFEYESSQEAETQ